MPEAGVSGLRIAARDRRPRLPVVQQLSKIGVAAVRYGLPVVLTVVGIWLLETRAEKWGGLGVMLIGTAVIVLMINLLFRLSIRSNDERAREERARDHYERHGRWPDWYA